MPLFLIVMMLGLPAEVPGCLVDVDVVLTRTATVHVAARQEMFDEFLQFWASRSGEVFVRFDRKVITNAVWRVGREATAPGRASRVSCRQRASRTIR
jgi:beta-phosphoglucomutase-like phosphatase (HAD superfamily)